MKKTIDYLNDALNLIDKKSDAKKAKELGITRGALSRYISGQRIMDNYACIAVAQKLGINPMVVIATATIERDMEKEPISPERQKVWDKMKEELKIED